MDEEKSLCVPDDISNEIALSKTTFIREDLVMGKYDINFSINLLRIIEKKCHDMQMNPKDISFTIREGCKRMIAMLEVEKRNQRK